MGNVTPLPPFTVAITPNLAAEGTMEQTAAHELWRTLAGPRGLTDDQIAQLEHYLVMLNKVNQVMNLTRVTEPEQARIVHVADAMTLLRYVPQETQLLADVGSGGGVPGIVLGVMLPTTRVVLIDSTQKKANFLKDVAKQLKLANLEVRPIRAEDAGRSELRDACDVVTARAVGPLNWIVEWCLPLVKKYGTFLAMKGPKLVQEIPEAKRALQACSGGEPVVHPVTNLPGQNEHVICEIKKIGKTGPLMPRSATASKGTPL